MTLEEVNTRPMPMNVGEKVNLKDVTSQRIEMHAVEHATPQEVNNSSMAMNIDDSYSAGAYGPVVQQVAPNPPQATLANGTPKQESVAITLLEHIAQSHPNAMVNPPMDHFLNNSPPVSKLPTAGMFHRLVTISYHVFLVAWTCEFSVLQQLGVRIDPRRVPSDMFNAFCDVSWLLFARFRFLL